MAIEGSPKKWAEDVSEGLHSLNLTSLKRCTPADIKVMMGNLQLVQKELRNLAVPEGDAMALKMKNMKMTRINQALMMINAFVKKTRMTI